MRRLVPVISIVLVLAATGCSGGTEEVTRDSAERSGAAADDDRSPAAEPDGPSTSAASGSDDASGEAAQDTASDDDATSGGSTSTGSGRTGSPGSANGAGSSGTAAGSGAGATGDGSAPSGDGDTPATTAPAPFRPDPDRYDTYVGLARQYGGDVAGREDANALASVFCSDPAGARAEFLGGEPLGTYPSDLAIVRAYCPDKEPLF